jgi:hypothetical protein
MMAFKNLCAFAITNHKKTKKGFQKIENPFLNQIIYENYCLINSKYKLTSTSLATPAPVGSYLIL